MNGKRRDAKGVRPTVLIVDDESGPREALKMILSPFYRVEEAEGGLQALQVVRKQRVDLVRLGACAYQTKPFNVSDVVREVARAVENKRKFDHPEGLPS